MARIVFTSICTIALVAQSSLALAAAQDTRGVVRGTAGPVMVNSFNNCVRTGWSEGQDACAPPAPPAPPPVAVVPVVAAPPPPPPVIQQEDRTVYFDFNKFTLTPDSIQKLNTLADRMAANNQIKEAKIAGYADRIGNPSYNEELSRKRAENVLNYLAAHGFLKGHVAETRWLGESAPVTQCPDSMSRPELLECLKRDRRVEVDIEYQVNP